MSPPVKFLVADPLAGVQNFARQLLQARGFTADDILCCADPDAALALGLAFKPHLLITDWFPRAALGGIQLYRRLREAQPGLQLALLSFELTPGHRSEAEAHGARFLLQKPFTAEQFKAEIGRVLDAPAWKLARPAIARPLLPPQLVVKPGDRVRFNGGLHVAQHVVHRHGETVVQLQGQAGFVPVEKLAPA